MKILIIFSNYNAFLTNLSKKDFDLKHGFENEIAAKNDHSKTKFIFAGEVIANKRISELGINFFENTLIPNIFTSSYLNFSRFKYFRTYLFFKPTEKFDEYFDKNYKEHHKTNLISVRYTNNIEDENKYKKSSDYDFYNSLVLWEKYKLDSSDVIQKIHITFNDRFCNYQPMSILKTNIIPHNNLHDDTKYDDIEYDYSDINFIEYWKKRSYLIYEIFDVTPEFEKEIINYVDAGLFKRQNILDKYFFNRKTEIFENVKKLINKNVNKRLNYLKNILNEFNEGVKE